MLVSSLPKGGFHGNYTMETCLDPPLKNYTMWCMLELWVQRKEWSASAKLTLALSPGPLYRGKKGHGTHRLHTHQIISNSPYKCYSLPHDFLTCRSNKLLDKHLWCHLHAYCSNTIFGSISCSCWPNVSVMKIAQALSPPPPPKGLRTRLQL